MSAHPEASDSRERQISSAVFRWATGLSHRDAGRVVLCTTGEGLAEIADRGSSADIYLMPTGEQVDPAPPAANRTLAFDGRFAEPGDVMHIGSGYEIEMKDYLAVPFTPIARPTIVSCTTSASWQAFFEDADEAAATGVFIPQLASPSAVLADRSVVDAAIDGTAVGVNRLTLGPSGSARYRFGGAVVGSAATVELSDQPVAAVLRTEGEPPEAGVARGRDLAGRPWIRRYLAALRIAGGAGGETWSISGFGAHLAGFGADETRRRSGHLIIWRGDEFQLVAESGRRFALGRESAIAVESLLESSSLDDAITTARAVGVTRPNLRRELEGLVDRLGSVGVTLGLLDARES